MDETPGLDQDAPPTLTLLGTVLQAQAAIYVLSALIGSISYFVRGSATLSLGRYASGRTHPVTMLIIGLVVGGVLFWHSRRIPARPMGLHRQIVITEWVLLLDGVLGMLFGIFNIWWVASLLAAAAVLWFLRSDDISRYLD